MKLFLFLLSNLFIAVCVSAKTLVIYHTSDVHGWYFSRPAKWLKENPERKIGGFAALASLLEKEKNPYILLDSGDMFQGTPEGTMTRGEASAVLMNMLGYSAAAVGNHEYDYGEKSLIENFVKKADFPLLGANVYYRKDGKPASYLRPYTILKKEGVKIAVLGLAGSHTSRSTLPANVKHLDFKDEASEAEKWTEKIIKKEKPDIIICLLHDGLALASGILDISTRTFTEEEAKTLPSLRVARKAKKIDILLGGHIHTGYLKGYYDKVSKTLITESYWGLTNFSKITVELDDKTNKIKSMKAELLPLWTDETGEDEAVLEKIAEIRGRVAKKMDVKIGEALTDIPQRNNPPAYDSPLGDWLSDIMREYGEADMAFQNTHGIRSPIHKGDVTMRTMFQVMPFDNTLVKMELTGAQIERLIRDNLRKKYSKMQISGLRVEFSLGENGKPEKITLYRKGGKIKPDEKFSVVTNNYLSSGGSGGKVFTEGKNIKDLMNPVREIMIDYVKKHGKISAPETGRILRK